MSHLLLPYPLSVTLCFLPAATVDLSCQAQRTISQPVTGQPQCPDSNTQLCTSEGILCSCFGEENLVEWLNALFERNIVFVNTGGTMVSAVLTDANTGASAEVTAVNPQVNFTTDLTLNVTTTAAVNAMEFNNTAIRCQDSSGPPGMEQIILLYGRSLPSYPGPSQRWKAGQNMGRRLCSRFLCAGVKWVLFTSIIMYW